MVHSVDVVEILIYFAVLFGCVFPIGKWMADVFTKERHFFSPVLGPAEKIIYKFSGIDPHEEMSWKHYACALLLFNAFGFLAVYLLQIFQHVLPFNPQGMPKVNPDLAFNTAVSFMTNTNWQAYSGEALLSYLVQAVGLTVQNFVSAATGMAVLLALVRGLTRKTVKTIGNFWSDLTKTTVYILLPLSFLWALMLVHQGVVQNTSPYLKAVTMEGAEQMLPMGPAASQIAIKQLGTNGGGFFGVNSTHPYENPTPFSNFLEMIAILLLPAAQVVMFGCLVKNKKQGHSIMWAMVIVFILGLLLSLYSENAGNPVFGSHTLMEGKEQRLGINNSVLWSAATTVASNGSVNAMHDSLTPLSGLVALFNIMLGEVIFGGVGAGLYGMLMFVILTVFIAGLMVGRTPEYLGKKIESGEILWAVVAVLAPCAVILIGAAIATVTAPALAAVSNKGPHGLSQILYAFSSAAGNNGSAFAGIGANIPFYNIGLGLAMLVGRFAVIIPSLAIAGNLAMKKITPPSSGTFPTDGPLFTILLIGVIFIVGALTFLPSVALGPVIEHFLMLNGRVFS